MDAVFNENTVPNNEAEYRPDSAGMVHHTVLMFIEHGERGALVEESLSLIHI